MPDYLNITKASDLGVAHAAFMDGSSHPVDVVYGSLAAALVDYPDCIAGQEIDGCAIRKAKQVSVGQPVYMPPGVAMVNKPILIDDVDGLRFTGTAKTRLNWTGDAAHPIWWLRGINGCRFETFAHSGSACSAGFRMTPHVGGPITPGSNEFDHLDMFVIGCVHGWDVSPNDGANDSESTGTLDANNELHHWKRCRSNFTTASFCHVWGTQAHALVFEDCQFLGGQYGVWCQYGAYFHWFRGSGGYTTVADFAMDAFLSGPTSIIGWNSEGSRRLLTVQDPGWNGDAGGVAVEHFRFSGIGVPDANNEDDAVIFNAPGPLTLRNSRAFEYLNACRPRINWTNFAGNVEGAITENQFRSGLPGDWPYPALRGPLLTGTDRNLYWQRSTSAWGFLSAEPPLAPLPLA